MDERVLAVNIPEAARRLGVSTRTVATLVRRRELPSRKVGRRRIIPVLALEAFVRGDQDPDGPTKSLQRSNARWSEVSRAFKAKAPGSPWKET
jgi:excisionase family DNA binding protein